MLMLNARAMYNLNGFLNADKSHKQVHLRVTWTTNLSLLAVNLRKPIRSLTVRPRTSKYMLPSLLPVLCKAKKTNFFYHTGI